MVVNELENILLAVAKKLGYSTESMRVILSNRPDLCDYQCDEVFKLAKSAHKNPIEIGESLVEEVRKIDNFSDYFDSFEFVKPGFINMTLSSSFINRILSAMYSNPKFNLGEPEKKETVVLDYGGPNVAKPLHVGHMRTAIVGESIKRILNFAGHKTIADVHLGDYGLQIGQVIYGVQKESIALDNLTIGDLDRIYPAMSALCKEDEEVKNKCAEITKELQDGNLEYREMWKKICEISSEDILGIYKYLDVSFDLWYGESDAYPYIPKVESIMKEKNVLQESEGAIIVDVSKETDKKEVPPLVFQKSNGAYLYATTDLATIQERMEDFNPDKILYITDSRQSLHFEQVFRAADLAGIAPYSIFEHLGYGTVNGSDGKPYKTRNGDSPKLQYLFDQAKEVLISKKETNADMQDEDVDKIVNAILKFADLQNNRERDYIFDISKFSEVVGKTGPYILYTYLRIEKIIQNISIDNHKISNNIYNNYDRDLRLKLLEFPVAFKNALEYRMPNYLADYVYDICVLTNAFYQNNHINGLEDEEKKLDWVFLLTLTNRMIKEMLSLLVINIPTVM